MPGYSPEVERVARQHGFKNAEQMDLFYKRRQAPSNGTVGIGDRVKEGIDDAMWLHPKRLFEYVLGKMQDAGVN